MRFVYSNIEYKKHPEEDAIVVSGEIVNSAGRHYHTVVFHIVLFIKAIPVANVNFVIHNFYPNQRRNFEMKIPELSYKLISEITRCEIYPESAY
jgi:hypothetical protein